MIEALLLVIALAGLAMVAAMAASQRRHLRQASVLPGGTAMVSILKPLKGLDHELEANLESWFHLDYADFEILMGARDVDDPAVEVARRVAARHPEVRSRVVVDGREAGYNPKVNNLANLHRHASGDLILIADSNVRVDADILQDLVGQLEGEGAGLVSAPIRGVGGPGLGASLESLQLNTFVMSGVAAAHRIAHRPCVVGKTMLVRRAVLEEIGGLAHLARFLAEDQVCGEDVAHRGHGVTVSTRPVDNVIGPIGVRDFLARHLRWARIRVRMSPLTYAFELVLYPAPIAAAGALLTGSPGLLVVALAILGVEGLIAARAERALGVARGWYAYPVLLALRDVLVLGAWAVPFMSRRVAWRGTTFRLGPRTLLEPIAIAPEADPHGVPSPAA